MSRIRHLRHVQQLGRNITPTQVGRIVGDDYEAFILVTVAEAVFPNCPPGVEAWLRQPDNLADWVEALAINASRHQIAWWTRKIRLGTDAEETIEAWRKLDALRRRFHTAVVEFHKPTNPRRHASTEEARAMERLRGAHREEHEHLVEAFMRKHGGYQHEAANTPKSVALLRELSDSEFRELVVADLSDRAEEDRLAHPALTHRWRDTLRSIGGETLLGIGLPPVTQTAQYLDFRVPDSHLPSSPDRETTLLWIRAIELLGLVEARILECGEHVRKYRNDIGDAVFTPAEEKLRDAYFAEYTGYRVDEEKKSREKRAAKAERHERFRGFPGKLIQPQEELASLGWDVKYIRRDDWAWLDIRRGDLERMAITVERKPGSGTSARSLWKRRWFSVCKPGGGWYRLPDLEAMMMMAALSEELYGAALSLITEERRILRPVGRTRFRRPS